jgi:hypothetical protein
MLSLEEIRRKLAKDDEKKNNFADNAIYQFWNIPDDKTAIVRFLPDGNESNPFFWVEKLTINLYFSGSTDNENTPLTVRVPCVEMYGLPCPILKEVRTWFKDPELEESAKKYWKKKSYIFQGFVVSSPFKEDNPPKNPIRRFVLNTSLFNIIKSSLMNPEMEIIPVDYKDGRDFRITKTKKGGKYADYSTSTWSIKSRNLSEEELEAIETYGLFNLSDFIPAKPDSDDLKEIYEMFVASVNGELFDIQKWGRWLKQKRKQDDETDSIPIIKAKNETSVKTDQKKIEKEKFAEEENNDELTETGFVDVDDIDEFEDDIEEKLLENKNSSRKIVVSENKTKTNPDDILARLKKRINSQ